MNTKHFALCLSNKGYPASLEVGKLYAVVKDRVATREGYIRVIDESGDDYAFTADRFHMIDLPASVQKTLIKNGRGNALAR